MTSRPTIGVVLAACVLAAGCGNDENAVDLSLLSVGTFSTAARNIPNQPSLPDGTLLEGIRMSDAVADTSQFGSPLIYLQQAGPVPDAASVVPIVGEELALLREFTPVPVAEIASLPRDPDGLLARMVAGVLRDQLPTIRKDKLYEKWGVDRFAVSGAQHPVARPECARRQVLSGRCGRSG